MAKYRKLGRTSDQRKALLRNQVTNLLYHGKIVTTETRAKEVRKIAESLIAMAVREKDNFETVTVTAKVARKDADGKRVKEVVDGKKVTVYDEVQKEIKKDAPSRLHARRQMLKVLYPVTEVPAAAAGKKKNTKSVDMVDKMFTEIARHMRIRRFLVKVNREEYGFSGTKNLFQKFKVRIRCDGADIPRDNSYAVLARSRDNFRDKLCIC